MELLVVLSIIGILATISIPSVITIVQNHRISATAERLYYDLQYAKSAAVMNNTTVYVSFQTGDSWCYGVNSGSSCNCTVAGNCGLLTNAANSAQQITLSTSGLTNNAIQFDGSHGAANASGSVTLTLYGQANLITINIGRLGGLQMCSTGISGYTGC